MLLVYDFGSQYTQLIARRIREMGVYCEILPYHQASQNLQDDIKGVILSGSPFSVLDDQNPKLPSEFLNNIKVPVLGICYGAQYIAQNTGGSVERSAMREYGRAHLNIKHTSPLLKGIEQTEVWMSHGDSITSLAKGYSVDAQSENIPIAAFSNGRIYGIQFHPEVSHTLDGKQLLRNFVFEICKAEADWTVDSFISSTVKRLKNDLGEDRVVMALSGGVDSSVAASLCHRAIGERLYCLFIDNGLLRKDEFEEVLHSYKDLGLNVRGIDAKQRFYDKLKGVEEPEQKRKIIGSLFVEIFQEQASKLEGIKWLGQGTIYPDVIESVSVHGPSQKIKSHHNVGGLPKDMKLKIVEPLRELFKDEVRRVGKGLGLPDFILNRHPFPGPGLGIRIIGEVREDKVKMLQEADAIYTTALRKYGLYQKIWQAGMILLPIQSVGVMGDERTYENVVAMRAVVSEDGMTADWFDFPKSFLSEVSNQIINRVKGINRVVYDISSKPPATIEWE